MKFKIPKGTKTLYKKFKRTHAHEWLQIQQEGLSDKVQGLVIGEVERYRRKGKLSPVVMLHSCVESVEEHTDNICKSCYVLPVVVRGCWIFQCESRKVKLEEGKMFKFSTFNKHSLVKLNGGMCVFYTVDYVPSNNV